MSKLSRIYKSNRRKRAAATLGCLILSLAMLVIAGCGDKDAAEADNDKEQVLEAGDEKNESTVADAKTPETVKADEGASKAETAAIEARYMDFINNLEPVYFTWFLNSENSNTSDWNYSEYKDSFRSGSAYVFSDFMEKICGAIEENFEVAEYPQDISYAFVDAGSDGKPELFIRVNGIAESMVDLTDVWGIKQIDGKLQVIFYKQYGYRTMFSMNKYGYYYYGGSSGAACYTSNYAYIDSDGARHFDYGLEDVNAVWSLYVDGNDTYTAVAQEQGIDENIEVEQYYFTEYKDGEDYGAYQQNCLWNYYELNHNGNRIENNDEIYKAGDPFRVFWDSTGLPLNTADEINKAIGENHNKAGLSDNIINAGEAEWIPLTDQMLDNIYAWAPKKPIVTVLKEPSWEYYYAYDEVGPCTAVELKKISETSNDIIDSDVWFNELGIKEPDALSFDDENYHYELYGEDSAGLKWYPYIMDICEKNTGQVLYTLDFSSYYKPPRIAAGDEGFVEESISWAVSKDDILYVSTSHSTYASSAPQNAYITALDMKNDFAILWRSEPLVCNSKNFVVTDDAIICGYGFTNEPDYIYVLNRDCGAKVGTYSVKTGPDWLLLIGNTLYVRCYDTNYEFEVNGL